MRERLAEQEDVLQVNKELNCFSGENEADKDGKMCCVNGAETRLLVKKRRLNEKNKFAGVGGKVEFVGRVLRSRTVSTLESPKIGCEFDIVVGGRSNSPIVSFGNHEIDSLDKSPKVMPGVVLETTAKCTHGRPPKVNVASETTELNVASVAEVPDETLNVVKLKGNSDDSDALLETTVKRKRGRPPKVNVGSETPEPNVAVVALDETVNVVKANSDVTGVELETTVKRKRGRPPKVNVGSETFEPKNAGVARALDESVNVVKANSDDSGVVLETTVKRKRGRPRKVNVGSETSEPNLAVVTKALDESLNAVKADSDDSDVLQVTTGKSKPGRSSKLKVRSVATESDVAVVEKVKGHRGRPPIKLETEAFEANHAVMTNLKRSSGRRTMFQVRSEAYDVSVIANSTHKQRRLPRLSTVEGLPNQETASVSKTKVVRKNNKNKQDKCPKPKAELRGMLKQSKGDGHSRLLRIRNNSRGQKLVNGIRGKSSAPCASKYDSEVGHGVDSTDIDAEAESMIKGRTLRSKRLTSSLEDKISEFVNGNNETSSRKNVVESREKEEKISGCGKSMEKHIVREKIKDMLLNFGWTIEYRPRMSKEYNDAVYVSPQGRAYWSVTRAYNVLKSDCKNIDAANTSGKSGFAFKPIPEELMNMLTRTTKKKKERLAKLGLHANVMSRMLNQKLTKTVGRKKTTLLATDPSKNNKKHSRTTKHSMRNAGSSKESRSQKVVELNGKVSRDKSKDAQTKRRRALIIRNSEKMDGSSTFDLYPGKRMVLNWMIDSGTIPLDANVHYRGQQQKTRRTHGGRIVRDGINCGCCNKVVNLLEFQVHARGKSDFPSQYIYLEDGTSLLQCQLLTWNKQDNFQCKGFHSLSVTCDDPNDDSCGICGNGGELICCDGCTSTFHLDCLNLPKFPSGEWHCIYCSCKFCGQVGGGSCCGNFDGFETFMLSTCHLCEAKYHEVCIQADLSTDDAFDSSSFCGTKCQEVLNKLMSLTGVKNELKDGYSWTLLHRYDVGSDSNHGEMPLKVECNSKLAVALSIMDECFLPIIDHRTGINLIQNVVYNCGSNFTRLNYSGFYTVILDKGDELISAASIRVHGDGLAEMPFIGTRHTYRRQGMCGRLLGAVEDALRSLGVKNLVIPAISELLQTWTDVFGFKPLGADERLKLKNVNLLVFPCTDMLQKNILETSKEHELVLATDAAGEHDNLDSKSRDGHETSSRNETMNMEIQELETQLDGLFNRSDHLSVEGAAHNSFEIHENPCNNGVLEAQATQGVHDPLKEANHSRADSPTSTTSFHSADEGFCTDEPHEVISSL